MKLYKGRVPESPTALMDQINRSLPFDIRLLPFDVAVNRAWAKELNRLEVFTDGETSQVVSRLNDILEMFEQGEFEILPGDEDVHTLVERLLTEELGPTGARIHTGRSRNDQVVSDLRLYTAQQISTLCREISLLIHTLADLAEIHADALMAGTTHLQPALPITLGHYLCSLAAALERDWERLLDCQKRANRCPLGAGAMAGSGFPVNRKALAEDLGFDGVLPNSIDAVSDRDFCQETVGACAILACHLSRYAEQLIIWANPAFGYVRFSGQWSTGSSMMPQKRNPDAMELVRGKAARIIGANTTLLSLTKGLPLTYAKDLQEDKEPLFDALDQTLLIIRVFREAIESATFFPKKLAMRLDGDMLATDLADALARKGVPFREAHERVGAFVSELEAEELNLLAAHPSRIAGSFPELDKDFVLDFKASVANRYVEGGTAPKSVLQQVARFRKL